MGSIVGYMSVPGAVANADLSSQQYRAVTWVGTNRRVQDPVDANDLTELFAGVLQDDPDAQDRPADVACFGMCKAELSGTVAVGDMLIYSNNGTLLADLVNTAMQSNANDILHIGQALEAGVSGDIIDVYINPQGYQGIE